jgi:hypothetical protein
MFRGTKLTIYSLQKAKNQSIQITESYMTQGLNFDKKETKQESNNISAVLVSIRKGL